MLGRAEELNESCSYPFEHDDNTQIHPQQKQHDEGPSLYLHMFNIV